MKDNPAMPFVFIVQRDGETSKINGEGNGPKEYSSAAFKELETMTESGFDELVRATQLEDSEDDTNQSLHRTPDVSGAGELRRCDSYPRRDP
jgi:hypothetical protein